MDSWHPVAQLARRRHDAAIRGNPL